MERFLFNQQVEIVREKKRRILILEILINVGWNESVDRIAR